MVVILGTPLRRKSNPQKKNNDNARKGLTNMMTNLTKFITSLAAAGLLTVSVQAVQISGGLSLAGGYVVNTGDLNTATAFSSFSNVITTSASGSYAGIAAGTAVTMTPFSFNPFPVAGVTPLWSLTATPTTSFDLLSPISVDQPGDNSLELRGSGWLKMAGFEDTKGTWIFTANQGGGTFSFSSSNAAVPDGGSTAVLLGLALLGVAAVRRKF